MVHLEQAPEDEWNRQVTVADCELDESKYPFEVDAILDKKFKQISKHDTRNIWQYRVQWLHRGDSWEPATLIAAIVPAKTSSFEAGVAQPEAVPHHIRNRRLKRTMWREP